MDRVQLGVLPGHFIFTKSCCVKFGDTTQLERDNVGRGVRNRILLLVNKRKDQRKYPERASIKKNK